MNKKCIRTGPGGQERNLDICVAFTDKGLEQAETFHFDCQLVICHEAYGTVREAKSVVLVLDPFQLVSPQEAHQ